MYMVMPGELDDYTKVVGKDHVALHEYGVVPTVANHRQSVIEFATPWWRKVIMMDDDLRFMWRTQEGKLQPSDPDHVRSMIMEVAYHLDFVPMVGVGPRMGNNRLTGDYVEINRCCACVGFDTKIFKEARCQFNPVPWLVGEDVHVNLQILNAGYKNRLLSCYAFVEKSGAEGGCSTHRTSETMRRSAYWLAEHHPEITVKVKESSNKGWATDTKAGRNFRVDFTVQWKKAYKPKKREGGLF